MSEEQALKEKQKLSAKKLIWRIVKISAVLGIIVFLLLTVLSRMGGDSDVLRGAVEDFLNDNTPYSARVTRLNEMQFFPDIVLDIEGLELRESAEGEAKIRVESFQAAMPFFDVMFRPGRFRFLKMQNLTASAGVLNDQPITIPALGVRDEEGDIALVAEGSIGAHDFYMHMGLEAEGEGRRRIYEVGEDKPFEIKLANLNASGIWRKTITGDTKFENVILSIGDQKAIRGNIDVDTKSEGRIAISGEVRLEPGQSRLDPNVVLNVKETPSKLFGIIRSDIIVSDDFTQTAPAYRFLNRLDDMLSAKKTDKLSFAGLDLDLKFDLQKIVFDKVDLGSLKTTLKLKDSLATLEPIEGRIVSGDVSGHLYVDANKEPPTLNHKLLVKGFDYGALQRQFKQDARIDGKADIAIDLTSQGQNITALKNGINGKVHFVGGKAEMHSGLLDLWGGGLLNSLLPSLSGDETLNVNCVVANFDIKNLKAQSDAMFVDTKRITLNGEGVYDFEAERLDLTLEPKAKDIAIGDLSAAVNVTGPLSDLSVSPNTFSLAKKAGGILLGTVNPAFYALTLTGLGLDDGHPCKEFVIEREELPPPEIQSPEEEGAEPEEVQDALQGEEEAFND